MQKSSKPLNPKVEQAAWWVFLLASLVLAGVIAQQADRNHAEPLLMLVGLLLPPGLVFVLMLLRKSSALKMLYSPAQTRRCIALILMVIVATAIYLMYRINAINPTILDHMI